MMMIIMIIITDRGKGRTATQSVHVNLCLQSSNRASCPVVGQIQLRKFWATKTTAWQIFKEKIIESLFPLKSLFH
jgi:hypothetical protein